MRHERDVASRSVAFASSDDTQTDFRARPFALDAFSAHVAATPTALALTCGVDHLTYAALNARANQLAHVLRAQGLGPEDLVAICLNRSIDFIVAQAGIWKAGAAFLPIDSEYPAERKAYIMRDAGVSVVITQPDLVASLDLPDMRCLTSDDPALRAAPETGLDVSVGAEHLAYVIYTSGSTGQPKGVEITHGNLRNLMAWYINYFAIDTEDHLSQLVAPAFDPMIIEIWPALMTGASLHVVDDETRANPPLLRDWMVQQGITMSMVPTVLGEQLLTLSWPTSSRPRRMLVGGEALHSYPPPDFPIRFFNGYGPTETTVMVTAIPLTPDTIDPTIAPPIGYPIANTRLHLLDAALNPVPQGEVGELFIGGAQVGRGYRRRPDLTRERFIPDPFSDVPDARLYRTGDLCRMLPNGAVAYVGRTDHQVKIRGYRIELGEIEIALQAHPAVAQVVVMAREDSPGDKRLVAYIVARPDTTVDAARLREAIQDRLPAYMIPAAFVFLAAFPMTANGKIDRAALPAPDWQAHSDYVAPRTPLEARMAEIWSEVLHVERVGIMDDFFAIGGHSLLATRAVGRMRTALRRDVTLRMLLESPTIASLAAHLQGLPEVIDTISSRPFVNAQQQVPLSAGQERLWFLDQLAPGTALYVAPAALRLPFVADHDLLTATLHAIAARHESWRTAFISTPEGPRYTIASTITIPLRFIDARDVRAEERENLIQREAQREGRTPFDLAVAPLVRATAVVTAPHETLLLLTQHHIITDGWSLDIITDEIMALYAALERGNMPAATDPTLHYADYGAWQQQWLASDEAQQQLALWKARLADVPTVLELPTDYPRPSTQTYTGELHRFTLDADLVARVQAMSRQYGVTPFMLLLAAYEVLLRRYSRQERFIIGTIVSGRSRPEFETMLGFFANTLPLPADLAGDPSFGAVLAHTRQQVVAAQEGSDIPFDLLLEQCDVERDTSYAPLVQVLFTFQTSMRQSAAQQVELDWEQQIAKFDLTLDVIANGPTWAASLEYNSDLFATSTIARMSEHFARLLTALLAAPEHPVSSHSLLSAAEQHQLLVEWNAATLPVPHATLPMLVEQQAARTPTATALIAPDVTLTYAEVNSRANRVAHTLRALGIEPGQIVGICLNRTPDLVTILLGILKTGAAYLPLDPAYPAERLAFSLSDANAALLITSSDLRALLPCEGVRICEIDTMGDDLARQPTQDLGVATNPAALGYIIYTSGSTGRPKGVAITHASAVTMITWAHSVYTREELAGVFFATSICFDISIFEMFAPLSCGGTIILGENALALPTHPARDRVTLIDTVPSAFQELAQVGGIPPSAGILNIAGEPLARSLVDRLYQIPTVHQCYNLYGPTEDTTFSTWAAVPRDVKAAPTVGQPLPNSQLYILDEHLQPVPIGVPGEVYIAGAGLTMGYLGRPDMTAERFIPNPFATDGARMYRTGDLARYRQDSEIEVLGRMDQQVKVRGFRIELGEIETVLARCDGVRDTVAVLRDDTGGNKQIVAYVVLERDVATASLRDALRAKLPGYMVPAAIVSLEALPLTPNGKVNRRALPAPTWNDDDSYVAPRTQREAELAALWADVLHVERVGVTDNFFALGGHSLLATRLVARIRATLAPDLPLRAIFAAPTIAELAAWLGDVPAAAGPAAAIPLIPHDAPLVLSSGQERLWFFDQLMPGTFLYNVPYALRLSFAVEELVLSEALRHMAQRHDSWRATFIATGEGPRQQIAPAGSVPLRMIDLRAHSATERDQVIQAVAEQEARTVFDLARGPLVQAVALITGDAETLLILTQHHIITDGASLELIIDELLATYHALQQNAALPEGETRPDYGDYAVWQHAWLKSDASERQQAAWRERLADYPTILDLPTDHVRPTIQTYEGATEIFTFDADIIARIKDLGRAHGATPYMILLAAFGVLLQRYTQQERFLVGTAVGGRNHTAVEEMWGFFVNTLPLPIDLADDLTFAEMLDRTRHLVLWAQEHASTPFEMIIDAVQPTRDPSYLPLIQVFFNVTETLAHAAKYPDVSVAPLDWNLPIAKFDLSLDIALGRDAWIGHFEYNTDLFERETARRITQHFLRIVRSLIAVPEEPVSHALLLDPESRDPEERAEWQRVVRDWNATTTPYPRDATISEIFVRQAEKTPDAVAIVCEEHHLTYGALLAQASQLAHHLRSLGVGPDERVGICIERSPHLIPALLGIILAGGAYVPLDPTYPSARLRHMLDDSGALLVLTQPHLHEPLVDFGVPLYDIEQLWTQIIALSTTPPAQAGYAEHLAYLCYTSGSTGVPKGAAIPHRGVLRLVLNTQYANLSADETFLQYAPLAFDAATFEIWGPLLNGGRLVIGPTGLVPLDVLGQHIVREGITLLWLTIGLFHLLVEEQITSMRHVRHVITGGDVMRPSIMKHVLETYPDLLLANAYGPTETTTFATLHPMKGATTFGRTVSIGTSIANSTTFVLDAHLRPLPVGVPGELYLGGDGLGRGYWQRPDLTAERFIPHPFVEGERFYMTGDIVRWLPGGTLEFIGRRDGQVKIRGFRIEIGEIERVLDQQEGVQNSIVIARVAPDGNKYLIGYVVGENLDGARLREQVQQLLPAYLVPSAIVVLPALPLMPSGKVDRRALPEPETLHDAMRGDAANQEPPQGALEQRIAAIWSDVLHRDDIGRQEDFFALGGHSLLATQLVARLRATFGIDMPLVAIFEHVTVASMAAYIAKLLPAEGMPASPSSGTTVETIQRTTRGDQGLDDLLNMIEGLSQDDLAALLAEDVPNGESTGR